MLPTLTVLTTQTNLKPFIAKYLLLFVLMASSVCAARLQAQTTFTAIQSGPWNDPDTWDVSSIPSSIDDIIIAGHTVSVTTSGESCNSLLLGMGDGATSGSLVFVGASSLTTGTITMGDINGATGTITMDAGATLTCDAVIEADPQYSGIYETNLGTIVFNGSFQLPYNLFQFNNLVINSGVVSTGGRNLPIEGDLTINNGATLDLGENTANRNTIAGTFTVNSGGTLRIGGGGTIPANFSNHSIGATSTIEYYGVAQTVATLNSSQNYGNLVISGSGLKEVNGAIAITGDLTINSGIFSVYTFSANRTSAGGTLSLANGATLRISGSGTFPTNFSTHVIGATSTVEYNGSSGQTIAVLNSSQKYGNLTATNSFKTLGGSITVGGTLTFGGTPNKLIIGSNTLTLEGQISGSLTGSRNFMGSASSNLVLNGAFNRTLFFDATTIGTTNVLNNLTLNHTSNISTLGNDLVLNGTLTFTGGKLAIGSRTINLKGNIVNTVTAGLRGGTSSKLILNGSVSPTLSMDQTTPGTTNVLSTLQINSSGQVITMANDLQMSSTLTFTAGKLAINGNTLTLKGAVTNTVSGGLRGSSTSNVVVNGTVSTSLSFDQTTNGTTNVLNNLTINSNAQTITLQNALRLTGTHTPTAGVFAAGGNYTIASTASSTANIAAGSTSGGYITGNVIVERFIPQNTNRAWRLLASPTNGQSIHDGWQEGQAAGVNGISGYGTIITSKSNSWAADGFDFKTPSNSCMTYDQSLDSLIGIPNTSQAVSDAPGYFIYIRGGRGITPSSSITAGSATTLRTTGTLYTGNQAAVTVPADKYGVIGNPYASSIDLRNVVLDGGCTGTSFYVWDPKLTGASNLGGYQTFTLSGGNYVVVPGGGSYGASGSVTNTIQSGAAFFVRAVGSSGTVSINESSKTSGSSMVFRPGSGIAEKNLIANLYAITDSSITMADGNMLLFAEDFSDGLDEWDSKKRTNFGENFGIKKLGTNLAVERRRMIAANDTIQYILSNLKRISYRLTILTDRLHDLNLQGFLEDRYLNTTTPLQMDDTTYYNFSVTAVEGSAANDRFRVVFRPVIVLPVRITALTAQEQNTLVAVNWKVSQELNLSGYQVERSSNGRSFSSVANVAAQGVEQAHYQWDDLNPLAGVSYYRIRGVERSGATTVTQMVKVIRGNNKGVIQVAPNPIQGSRMNLQLVNQSAGQYKIVLTSMVGVVVLDATVFHTGGSTNKVIALPSSLAQGSYQLLISTPAGEQRKLQVLIQ